HIGIFLGVIIFGSLADRKGRMTMLFISVFTYSLGTLLSGLVQNYYLFVFLRFIVGLGLASELAIGLVLVCEIFPKDKRTSSTVFIALCGFLGMFSLSILAKSFHWRTLYIGGGLLGLAIMLFRFSTFESDIFLKTNDNKINKKPIFSVLKDRKIYYLILSILPTYLITASSVFIGANYFRELKITTGQSLMFFSLGAGFGFIVVGFLARKIKSRKKSIIICMFSLLMLAFSYILFKPLIHHIFLITNFLFGIFVSYHFELLTLTIEQFGTNLRAMATTLVFGVGRASVFIFSLLIPTLDTVFNDYLHTILLLDCIVFGIGIWSISQIEEEYGKDLNFVE
ncbi:MAG: MFS transporter, partial [Emticicia sp.]|uniref:MFS transporter n=1 Tax=Emticicia sp. TaxID=1930953 RepID=UPI003BA7FE8F